MIIHMYKFLLSSLIVYSIYGCAQSQTEKHVSQKLDVLAFKSTLETVKNVQLIDVRTREEFASGHLMGSLNYDIYLNDFETQLASLDKAQPVMVYCKGGGRSAEACEKLVKMGFHQVYDMSGGFMAWESKGFPTEGMQGNMVLPDKITKDDFTAMKTNSPLLLVDFYAPWCAPCKKMEPILEKLSKEFSGKIKIERINVDDAKTLCKEIKVESLPVVATYKSGIELNRQSGFQDEAALRAMLQELLK